MKFFVYQFDSKPSSLYSTVIATRTTLTLRISTPKSKDTAQHTGTNPQRSLMAFCSVMRPEGIGRSGLFSASSSRLMVWLETSNCSRCSQIHNNTRGMQLRLQAGATTKESIVCNTRQIYDLIVPVIWDRNAYDRYYGVHNVWLGEQEKR